jgi:hypothetical protein
VIPVAKTTVNLDNKIVQSLLQGDLTCLQSVVKDLIEHALETKAEEILQAKRYERTPERKGYRNGYRSRWVTTRLGSISIRVPQMRGGGLDTEELKLLPRFEQAFLLTLLEMVINGAPHQEGQAGHGRALRPGSLQEYRQPAVQPSARTGGEGGTSDHLRGRTIPFSRLMPW